jgi:23S rRNA (guanosine2251-2'-O)-methyltransferase
MAGNSKRRGAIKKTGKGNPTAGSGGRVKRGLEGRGPTPKAEDRPNHKAYKMARAADKREVARPRRKSTDNEWVAGRNSVVEALRARVPVTTLYFAEHTERDDRLKEILRIGADLNLPMSEVSRLELDRLTTGAVHQGVAAKVPAYEYAHPDDLVAAAEQAHEPPLIVALDSVTDPRNLGAVVRSASGFGAHGVLIPERRAAGMTASAWKTSAGAAARVPVARTVNLTRQLTAYAEQGLMIAGLAADGEISLPDLDLADGPLVLVVGSEGKGLSRLVSETCDVRVSIPMASSLESLNAGVAGGIALYEIARRRGF